MIPTELKVKAILIDWFYSHENGEEYCSLRVGNLGVKGIEYHPCMAEGDKHYCDVYMEDGSVMRKFNVNSIEFEKPITTP